MTAAQMVASAENCVNSNIQDVLAAAGLGEGTMLVSPSVTVTTADKDNASGVSSILRRSSSMLVVLTAGATAVAGSGAR